MTIEASYERYEFWRTKARDLTKEIEALIEDTPDPDEDPIDDKAVDNVQRFYNLLRQTQRDICGLKWTLSQTGEGERRSDR